MSHQVIQLSPAQLNHLIEHYRQDQVTRNANGVQFAAKVTDTSITAYTSGKVLFQGAGAEREAAQFSSSTESSVGKKASPAKKSGKSMSTKSVSLPANLAMQSVIGSDETGTGDFFGPVTVAACFVPTNKIALIQELGARDSKQLNDDIIRQIAPDIEKAVIHSVLVVPNEKYNAIQQRGYSQGKIKALLHNQALKHVLRKMDGAPFDHVLIDQFAEPRVYYNYLKDEEEVIRDQVLFATKAEGLHVAVAAASILARYAFLNAMDALSKEIGLTIPKGAGKKVDEVAAKILLSRGAATLTSITKWHFANTKKAEKIAAQKRHYRS